MISILNLYHMMHLFNTIFKSFYSLIHDDVLLISIICNYEKIFQLIISNMSECFQSFDRFFKSFNVNFIAFV